jgi:uracil-DNA glycosylase family 4
MTAQIVQLPITTLARLKDEFSVRASQCGLSVECGADGTFNAEIAVIAEAPGESEVSKHLPLIGHSGQLLWQVLRTIGVKRYDCYITNVCKRQVSFGQEKRDPINKHEKALWNELLLWELSQLPNLRYVVCLGNFALTALTGKEGIMSWRGSVLPVTLSSGKSAQCVFTYNPAMILREPKTEITFRLDIAKLKKVMEGKHRPKNLTIEINPTADQAIEFIDLMQKEAHSDGLAIATDIEVIAGETACIGLANDDEYGMCINFRTADEQRFPVHQEREVRKRLQRLFNDTEVKIVGQNINFDSYWLWFKDKIRIRQAWHDTMLAHHCLYPTLPHNLGFLTTQYTDNPFYKDEKVNWRETGGNIDDFWRYNGRDCCHTYEIHRKLERELEQAGLHKFFHEHVMRLQPHLVRMTVAGNLIDTELKDGIKQELAEEVSRRLADFHRRVSERVGDADYRPNPRSPNQLAELFFRKLKLVGRGTSTDADNRQRMYNHPRTSEEDKGIITAVNAYAEEAKFLSTYAEMQLDEDKRARCEWKQTGTQSVPGRLSSTKVLWGSGMNLQNQPDRAHPMFIADAGYTLVYFDMAQAEARLVAYFANIIKWKEQFERARIDGSYDAHRALASEMFHIPYDEVPTADRIQHEDGSFSVTVRFTAKRCRHGLNYRMQADRLAQTTGLSLKEATIAFNAYHRATPELRPWWAKLEKEVRTTKMLFNAYGRRLIFLERLTTEALESIVAFKPQSTLGDHVCSVMYLCEDDERWPEHSRMWLNGHDSLIAMVPHDNAKTALRIMKEHAERPIMIGGEPLIIPADTKISEPDEKGIHRWSTLKKCKLD